MAKSIKLGNNYYLDSSVVVFGKATLDKVMTYSTEEQVIGKWIDGKPLYRKMIIVDSIGDNADRFDVDLNISNFEKIWIDESTSFIENSNEVLGVNWFYGTSDYMRSWINKSSNIIRIKSPSNLSAYKGYYNIMYTKTTD